MSGGGIILGGLAERGSGRASPIDVAFAQENDHGGAQENYDEAEEGSCTSSSMSEVAPPPRHGNHVAAAY